MLKKRGWLRSRLTIALTHLPLTGVAKNSANFCKALRFLGAGAVTLARVSAASSTGFTGSPGRRGAGVGPALAPGAAASFLAAGTATFFCGGVEGAVAMTATAAFCGLLTTGL